MDYIKLPPKQYPPRALRETAEGKYWGRFQKPLLLQQIGAVTHVDFSQQWPYNFAVTASTRVRCTM
jgi:U3 small nucleolar RNA-associated protein 15